MILLQCYSAKELFESFSVDSNGLNLDKFEKVCPAIVQQIESNACLDENEDMKEDVKQSNARGTTISNKWLAYRRVEWGCVTNHASHSIFLINQDVLKKFFSNHASRKKK